MPCRDRRQRLVEMLRDRLACRMGEALQVNPVEARLAESTVACYRRASLEAHENASLRNCVWLLKWIEPLKAVVAVEIAVTTSV